MKRVIIALIGFAFITTAYAQPEIPAEFYLENGNIIDDSKPVVNVLPNTLRVEIEEGEEAFLTAEALPAGGAFSWSISDGSVAELYPSGEKCTVRGARAGSALIRVSAENSPPRLIAVEVSAPKEIAARSFKYEGEEPKPPVFTASLMRTLLGTLVSLGTILTLGAVILFLRRKKQ